MKIKIAAISILFASQIVFACPDHAHSEKKIDVKECACKDKKHAEKDHNHKSECKHGDKQSLKEVIEQPQQPKNK